MKILKEQEYNDLLIKSRRFLPLKAKLDKINILIEEYNHGKNIYTVMRDIKETVKEVWNVRQISTRNCRLKWTTNNRRSWSRISEKLSL